MEGEEEEADEPGGAGRHNARSALRAGRVSSSETRQDQAEADDARPVEPNSTHALLAWTEHKRPLSCLAESQIMAETNGVWKRRGPRPSLTPSSLSLLAERAVDHRLLLYDWANPMREPFLSSRTRSAKASHFPSLSPRRQNRMQTNVVLTRQGKATGCASPIGALGGEMEETRARRRESRGERERELGRLH